MIRARNAIEADAKDILVREELLLPILKAFPQCTRLYTLFEMVEASCVCVYVFMCVCVCVGGWVVKDGNRTVCRSHQHSSSPTYGQKSPARRQTCPPP